MPLATVVRYELDGLDEALIRSVRTQSGEASQQFVLGRVRSFDATPIEHDRRVVAWRLALDGPLGRAGLVVRP
ncbi:MAG: hypothetical protein AAFX79_00035 [Planctomycetota bacterium]